MNIKRILGVCLCAIGIYLIIAATQGLHKVEKAEGFTNDVSNFFQHNPDLWNPLIKFFGGKPQEELKHKGTEAILVLVGGICSTILGVTMVIVCRGHKKNK